MTPAERALAVVILLGTWLGIAIRAVLVVALVVVLAVVAVVVLVVGMSAFGQRVERGTRY